MCVTEHSSKKTLEPLETDTQSATEGSPRRIPKGVCERSCGLCRRWRVFLRKGVLLEPADRCCVYRHHLTNRMNGYHAGTYVWAHVRCAVCVVCVCVSKSSVLGKAFRGQPGLLAAAAGR